MVLRMLRDRSLSRRSFLAVTAGAPLVLGAAPEKSIPIGLEMYSVRHTLEKELKETTQAVCKMGYQVVEFYNAYNDWSLDTTREIRKLLDDSGVRCYSTHNSAEIWNDQKLPNAIERNHILGTKYFVMSSPGTVRDLDGWKRVAEKLTSSSQKLKAANLRTGYHNHGPEFTPIDGKRPMEVVAANTPKEIMLQLDVGHCVSAGSDPVAWIKANPGRINSLHLKDWGAGDGPERKYRVLLGEGDCPWKQVFQAAESVGGVEYYLVEQEGSRYSELETAQKCLQAYTKLRT
jgi:sugar phosphate isomerase/epimerase